jgi:hypothetical protein
MFEHGLGIKNPLFFIGVVENVSDPTYSGRVQVRAFGIHGLNDDIPTEDLPWAIVIKGDYDPNGTPLLGLPAENSWVFGFFADGRDAQQPMILGLIPTPHIEPPNPEANGYGSLRTPNGGSGPPARITSRGSMPEDFGQPAMSRLARAEDLINTMLLEIETLRVRNVRVGGTEESTFEEPPVGYDAQYLCNRVFQTANHTIELDDSPGAERIMITHSSGSYINISSSGTTTHHSTGDSYDITDERQNVYVGGPSIVTIMGNSHVYVRGNKTEEIEGDLETIVHGNHILAVGGQMNFNASEQVQMRAADVKIQANVGTLSIHAAKELQTEAGIGWYGKAPRFWMESSANMNIRANNINVFGITDVNIRANSDMNIHALGEMNIKADELYILGESDANLYGTAKLQIGSGGKLSVYGPTVAIDDIISMANGEADAASAAGDAVTAEASISAGQPELPEPPPKSTSVIPADNPSAGGGGGATSGDYRGENVGGGAGGGTSGGAGGSTAPLGDASPVTQTAVTPLLQLINRAETNGRGYNTVYGGITQAGISPPKPLVEMTIQEVLDFQDSIDHRVDSEAMGMYQIVEDTLRGWNNGQRGQTGWPRPRPAGAQGLYEKAGLSASDLFNGPNQDKMAIVLLREKGLDQFLAGSLELATFANRVAGVWAGLPLVTGARRGQSQYEGRVAGAYNSARVSVTEYENVLQQIRGNYNSLQDAADEETVLAQTVSATNPISADDPLDAFGGEGRTVIPGIGINDLEA